MSLRKLLGWLIAFLWATLPQQLIERLCEPDQATPSAQVAPARPAAAEVGTADHTATVSSSSATSAASATRAAR